MSDSFLEEAAAMVEPLSWMLAGDLLENSEDKEYLTTVLINQAFSRHLINSMEHLITSLSSSDMDIVVKALDLLYLLSKQTKFITMLNNDERKALLSRLTHMAESWGGKENGFGLADCCRDVPAGHFPPSSTTLHFEYYSDVPGKGKNSNLITSIHIENVDKINKTPREIMDELLEQFNVPADKQVQLFIHIQLAHCFPNRMFRLLCVEARLQALSILVHLNALDENAHTLLYSGLLEELIELVEMPSSDLVRIRAAALNVLTSILHLDGSPCFSKEAGLGLNMIIDITGAGSYYGVLPALVRTCIMILTSTNADSNSGAFPLPLTTALFSFLYYLASYKVGSEALISCGMMESLLRVINCPGTELGHIIFVIRAVQVVYLMTDIDVEAFETHDGLTIFINRIEMEVNICRKEWPFEITFPNTTSEGSAEASTSTSRSQDTGVNTVISPMEVSSVPTAQELCYGSETEPSTSQGGSSTSNLTSKSSSGSGTSATLPDYTAARTGKTCLPQRAVLLTSMLNFLRKAIQEKTFSDSTRHVMEGSLPSSLKHIISNAEYYGPSIFLLATDIVTMYVLQEPSLLSSLQDNGLTDVVLHALLVKDVPATQEVLGSLRNVFRALCLNTRGLGSFVRCDPFNRLFKMLLSPVYLAAMRRRRRSETKGDTASNLGNAVSELMRHQPSLKVDATYAIIKLLEELCFLGRDPKYVCWRAQNKMDVSPALAPRPSANNEGGSSDKKDEAEASTSSHPQHEDSTCDSSALHGKTPIALIDYILNVMKFVDAILSNRRSDDHCREFVARDGLVPLLSILGLPNLPVDCPVITAVPAVISVCKSILNLTHEPQVLKQGLLQLNKVLEQLQPLRNPMKAPGNSVLLHELASAPNLETAFTSAAATPLLHAVGAAYRYVVMFTHVCPTGQGEVQTLSLTHWGSELGLNMLTSLAELYTSLVWESTLLLALCSDDDIPPGFKFGIEDMEKHLPPEMRGEGDRTWGGENMDATNSDSTMEVDGETMVTNEKSSGNRMLPTALKLKYIKPLLGASSRLVGALAELFRLLVKFCVEATTPAAHAVAAALNILLANSLNWTRLPQTAIPKFKLTFLICSVGFTFPMLFDEKKYPYHIMLQKFFDLEGQNIFMDTFRWVLSNGLTLNVEEGLEHPDLTDGTGEFLDAWLMLLEKMVNPKAILNSPHIIAMMHGAIFQPFESVKYLMKIQEMALDAVMQLWHKKPLKSCGARISESMLAILHHILRGEKIITEFRTQVVCKEAIDSFTMTALPACLNLVDTLPDTVYRVCDLLITITKRNGELWRDEMLDTLVVDIFEKAKYLLEVMETGENLSQVVSELMNSSAAMKIAGRIHLFTLLFEGSVFQEMRVACAQVVQRSQILSSLVQLLVLGQEALTAVGEVMTPKWLAPLLLLIDLHEEVAMCTQRRDRMYKVTNHIWRWFDLTSGKWTTYSSSNNKIINDAYWNGDAMVRLNCGSKRYMIQFAEMYQVDEETANRRPITMSLVTLEKAEGKDHTSKEKNYEKEKIEKMETEDSNVQEEKERKKNVVVQGLERADTSVIVRACVGLLSIPVDRETFHAVMRVCLRLTRNFENAMIFADLGGVRMLLDLTQASSFPGFLKLSTLLIRHVMEDPQTLRHAMEKVLRIRTLPNIPPPYKELLYLLRNSPSVVSRDPETFLEVARSSLRVDLHVPSKRNKKEDVHLLMKTLPSKHTPELPIQEEVSTTVVYDLLNCLIRPTPREDPTSTTSATNAMSSATGDGGELQTEQYSSATGLEVQSTGSGCVSNSTSGSTSTSGSSIALSNGSSLQLVGQAQRASTAVQQSLQQERLQNSSSSDLLQNEVHDRTQELGRKKMREDLATCVKINEEKNKRPLLPKSAILKILAEAVRSYSGCAKIITDHTYCAGQSDMVTQDCTALAFLLDKLLPVTDNPVDRECSTMARMLIAALASCNHSPNAQAVLVTEVKAALLRTLSFPESADKHAQIQLLTGLISTMIDNCLSTPNNTPLSPFLKLHQYSSHINNIVRIMLRKGILTDLARVSHYLDLSSPNMPASVNAALEPLETVSQIVNNPTETSSNNIGKQKTHGSVSEEPAGDQTGRDVLTGTTTSEATRTQGEETDEDAENTENDISAAAESLEPTSGSQVQEVSDDILGDEAFEEVMEQLLDWRTVSSEANLFNASFNMGPEAQNNAVDNEHGGVRNQTNSTYENEEDGTQDADDAESSDSNSDTNVEDDEDDDEEDDYGDVDDIHHPIPPSHPLVMARQNLEVGSITASQTRWENQQRLYQYDQLNHQNPDPPVIVQRLLGNAAYDIPTSTSQTLTSLFRGIRVVLMDNGLRILINSKEEINFVDELGYLTGPSLLATLNYIPEALQWWVEECKILDGDSSLDCVTAVVHSLVPHLEKLRDEELAERREKRKKQQEEEETKKRKIEDDSRVGTTSYAIHTEPAQWGAWNSRQEAHPSLNALSSRNLRMREQQLLDYEATSCLLVLLFVDKPKLNTGRLNRVLRNLCYHAATREWVIKALLSIMEKCNDCQTPDTLKLPKSRRMSTRSQPHPETAVRNSQPSWLNISLDAALGCRASVFTIVKQPGKRGKSQDAANVTIHPQAAPIVFRHTLEVLISLAKKFSAYFLLLKTRDERKYKDPSLLTDTRLKLSPGSSGSGGSRASCSDGTSFWEFLLRLESVKSKKGKSVGSAHRASNLLSESEGYTITFETSAFGQLLTMLASPVVKQSCLLTDKLFKLLSLISIGLPEVNSYLRRYHGHNLKTPEEKDVSVLVSEQHLKLAIDVLTSKSCSEEGLEDATALLLNLANCPDPTRDMILHSLLDGAMELANMANDHIGIFLQELKAMNRNLKTDENEEMDRPPKGVVLDRFTNENIIVNAPTKIKTSCDLQLPSMATLTSKTSSQAFFLRILKVITEIHESVRLAPRRIRENSESLDYFLSSVDEGGAGADEAVPGSAMDMSSPSIATSHARRASSNAETVHAESSASSRVPSRRQGSRSRESESDHAPTTPGTANVGAPTSAPSADAFDVDSDAEIAISTPQWKEGEEEVVLPTLSEQLTLDKLWDTLSSCLLELADTPDHHAVLVLQPAVEAFFLVYKIAVVEHQLAYDGHEEQHPQKNPAPPEVAIIQPDVAPVSSFPSDNIGNSTTQPSPAYLNFNWEVTPPPVTLPPDQQKFLKFAETHRTVLNQILRQSTTHLADGPFAVLVDHTRVLDFDVKRRYFRSELERMDEGIRREDIAVHVRRSHVFEDSFRELHRRSADEWKNRFYIVFEGEEGQDAGGLLREWYVIISREIFNPMYALFTTSPGDRVTYMINSSSHCNPNHLCYFKFVGRVIGKAIYDNKLLECYFTRSFYKHILGILVKYTDMESEDYSFYQGLVYLMEHHVSDLGYDLTFSAEVQEFGVTDVRDLIPNGRNIQVCEQNRMDYIRLVCQMKMTGAIRKQINAFLEGFYDIIPKQLISIFNEQELELLISGLPNVDIEDLRANTEYHKYQPTSLQIQWFWRALRSFDQAARAKFLQFVTGTSKVPLQGFATLEGMNGVQKFQIHRDDCSTDHLPSAHTCFNQLDLPVYETYDKLRTYLLKAIHECSEGFGFA